MKYLIAALSAALLILGILVYYQGKHAARQEADHLDENRRFQEVVSQIQAAAAKDRAAVTRIRNEKVRGDSIFQANLGLQKQKTAREQRKVTELRPQIDQLADSITVLAQFLEANDSLFHGKDVEIALLTQKISVDSVSHTSEVKSLESQITTLQEANVKNLERVDGLERSLAKVEKKSRKRLSVGITGGYSITQYENKLITGPSITGGVHYRIFSF